MSFRFISSGAAVALAMGLVAVPAAAESQPPPAVIQLAQAPEEAELVAFAAATIKILQIQRVMQSEVEAADEEDAASIQAEGQELMIAAVEEEGLTVAQYNEYAQLTRTDANVAETVERLIEQQLTE